MSHNMNNFKPLPGLWRTSSRSYDAHTSNNSEANEVPVFYRSHSTRAIDERNQGPHDPLRLWEVRTPARHHRIPNFPTQPHSRQQSYVPNPNRDMRRGFNLNHTRLRDIFPHPPPSRSTQQPSTQVPSVVENSKSFILTKLKKAIYNPTPKRLARNMSLYYRNSAKNDLKEKVKEIKEDGMKCTICLEDFEPKEEVMLTPCNHMFHEDCMVPWLRNKGQCPVCRFVIVEEVRENPSSLNMHHDIEHLEQPSNLIAGEFLSILRAMEEAFHLGSVNHNY